MIRIRVTVTYKDGRTAEVDCGTAAFAEWELYALRHGFPAPLDQAPRVLMTMYIAYTVLGIEEGFDVWRKTVDSISDANTEEIPPTPPEASGDSGSNSHSQQVGAWPT